MLKYILIQIDTDTVFSIYSEMIPIDYRYSFHIFFK